MQITKSLAGTPIDLRGHKALGTERKSTELQRHDQHRWTKLIGYRLACRRAEVAELEEPTQISEENPMTKKLRIRWVHS